MTGLLLDHLWQSTLFAAAASLAALALGRHTARVRFWIWFAAAAKFLVPFALIAAAAAWLAAHLHAQAPPPPRLELARRFLEPMTAPAPSLAIRSLGRAPLDIGPYLALAWSLGLAAIASWRAVQWQALRRVLNEASPVAVPTPLPTVVARAKSGPAVVGFLRPILVLPPGLTERLTPAELEAVLEHELHHARRRDNLLALPLLLAQALFWFHPLVWWIGRRLLAERERACDEAVLQGGTDAETYARGLLEVCRLELEPSPLLAAAAMGGADLKRRVRRIMSDRPPRPLGPPARAMLAAAMSAAVAVPVLAGVFSAAPAGTAPALARLARPFVVAVSRRPTPANRPERVVLGPSQPKPVAVTLVSVPAALTEVAAYAPPAEHPIRLARRLGAPAFQPAPAEPVAAAAQTVDYVRPSTHADLLRGLADRTAYVVRAEVWGARLDLRSDRGCPNAEVASAERRLAGEAISTAFDDRVRRFVDETLVGRAGPRDLSPAMALAVDKSLPVLQPALAGRLGPSGEARLIGEDSRGRDVYLVRAGAGYVLVRVDDLGQIEAAIFCAPG